MSCEMEWWGFCPEFLLRLVKLIN
jgi:hypothetical protein